MKKNFLNNSSVTWFKDDEPYPWTNFGSSLPILFAKNQSLVIVNMTPKDEGQYKCVASDGNEVNMVKNELEFKLRSNFCYFAHK